MKFGHGEFLRCMILWTSVSIPGHSGEPQSNKGPVQKAGRADLY